MKKRYFAKKPKSLPKGYDSKLELRLHETALKDAQHHVTKDQRVPYKVEHDYEPDFLFTHYKTMIVVEVKGRFRDSTEAAKYKWIRKCLGDWKVYKESNCNSVELVIIFENASTPMPFSKKRKDGTKQSHGEWASKNNFRWLCEKRGDLDGVETRSDLIRRLDELGE